jgi:ArsR family transcriptional regulator, arsenate/arsenite/antimonite-responsive transcriptional repressor
MSKQAREVLGQSTDGGCCPPLASAPLDAGEAAELATVFKALGDPVRLRLLSLIASREGGEVCVCELTPAFELSQPTISHHLKLLRQAGLVDCERRGTWVPLLGAAGGAGGAGRVPDGTGRRRGHRVSARLRRSPGLSTPRLP